MIAAWMLYCSLCALGLSVAAVIAERALLGGRGPVRFVWIGAVALSLVVPAVAFRFAPRPGAANVASLGHDVVRDHVLDTTLTVSALTAGLSRSPSPGRNWHATLARFDESLAVAWVTLSLALAVNFFGGIVTLAWMRRRWQRRIVLDVSVYVSERTGPAVVGAISPAIVMPEWVLALEPPQLALLLRHEQEHRRAGDGLLLTAAQLALIAMPWNVALWWQIVRLRVAVELDCDVRVLRDADARSYGDLLLEVARPRRRPSLMGATAFAERATQLERRIRVLGRHRVRTSRAARAMATCIGLAAVTVAWIAPRPPAPARAPTSPAAPARAAVPVAARADLPTNTRPAPLTNATASTRDAGARSNLVEPFATDTPKQVNVSTITAPAIGRDSAQGASAPRTDWTAPLGGRSGGAQGVQPPLDSVFKRLFDGITLTPDQEAKARDMLLKLQQEQVAQDEARRRAILENGAKTTALQAKRDSALRALLTNEADRATFDARVAQGLGRGGGRGRSVGPGLDPVVFRAMRLRDTSLAGGRRGGGGGGRESVTITVFRLDSVYRDRLVSLRALVTTLSAAAGSAMAEATFRRLFDGITLTPYQDSSARALITRTQQEMPQNPPLEVRIRLNPRTGVVTMQAASASALIGLLTNDADREKLRSRIVTAPTAPPPRPPQMPTQTLVQQ